VTVSAFCSEFDGVVGTNLTICLKRVCMLKIIYCLLALDA